MFNDMFVLGLSLFIKNLVSIVVKQLILPRMHMSCLTGKNLYNLIIGIEHHYYFRN